MQGSNESIKGSTISGEFVEPEKSLTLQGLNLGQDYEDSINFTAIIDTSFDSLEPFARKFFSKMALKVRKIKNVTKMSMLVGT